MPWTEGLGLVAWFTMRLLFGWLHGGDREWAMKTLLILSLLLAWSSCYGDNAAETIGCHIGKDLNGCVDPCIHFGDGTIASRKYHQLNLYYKRRIFHLEELDVKIIRRKPIKRWAGVQDEAAVPGDIVQNTFIGKKIRIEMTEEMLNTSCFVPGTDGSYEPTEGECDSTTMVELKINFHGTVKRLKGKWYQYSEKC